MVIHENRTAVYQLKRTGKTTEVKETMPAPEQVDTQEVSLCTDPLISGPLTVPPLLPSSCR